MNFYRFINTRATASTMPRLLSRRRSQQRLPMQASIFVNTVAIALLGLSGCDPGGNDASTEDDAPITAMTAGHETATTHSGSISTSEIPDDDTQSEVSTGTTTEDLSSSTHSTSSDSHSTSESEGTSTTGIPGTETGESTSSDSDEETTGECLPNPHFTCTVPYDCDKAPDETHPDRKWICGALHSPLDSRGCLRPRCTTHQDCPGEERCFNDWVCNPPLGCNASNMICSSGSPVTCGCSGADDCSGPEGWCVPQEIFDCPGEKL